MWGLIYFLSPRLGSDGWMDGIGSNSFSMTTQLVTLCSVIALPMHKMVWVEKINIDPNYSSELSCPGKQGCDF